MCYVLTLLWVLAAITSARFCPTTIRHNNDDQQLVASSTVLFPGFHLGGGGQEAFAPP